MGWVVQPALDSRLEAIVRRDRRVVAASLVAVIALAWIYLWLAAGSMNWMDVADMPDMPDMPMPGTPQGLALGSFVLTFLMWTVMMIGMMLPGAAPTILLYAVMVRKNGARGTVLPGAWVFASGYLAIWTVFSLVAALLQVALEEASLVTPMMVSASRSMSAAILVAAGIYQWLPIKDACLRKCQGPLQFFVGRWRAGAAGAFRMGAESGLYCLGCCWVLMLLLFVAGIMNLLWVAVIAGFVLLEKLLPAGRILSRFAGLVLVLAGVALLVRP
jgi:predicted metal-binding membrane protein